MPNQLAIEKTVIGAIALKDYDRAVPHLTEYADLGTLLRQWPALGQASAA